MTPTLVQFVSFSLLVSSVVSLAPQQSPVSSRRSWAQSIVAGSAFVASSTPACASLLDEFGSDPSKIAQTSSKEDDLKATLSGKSNSAIGPNLRSNYYYPTNKARYLPRIKKCNDAIPLAAESIGREDWDAARDFAEKVAEDTILPLKLYTSSLTGGGTNVKVGYTKTMLTDADAFEKSQKLLVKAVSKRDQNLASTALEGLAVALQDYRTVASLTGPDGGGDIPSVDDIRRAAYRAQGRFDGAVLARDARIKSELSSSSL